MKIAILGSGMVGQALAEGLTRHGHEVVLGTRNPDGEQLKPWRAGVGSGIAVETLDRAAAGADMCFLCTRWDGTENAIALAKPSNLSSKTVVDVTNPLAPSETGPQLAVGHTDSGGEIVQRLLPESQVVKALNIINASLMVDPVYSQGPPDMFICGNSDVAKAAVSSLLGQCGWEVTDIGGIEGARLLEPLAMLWVTIGLRQGTWNHAFKLIRP